MVSRVLRGGQAEMDSDTVKVPNCYQFNKIITIVNILNTIVNTDYNHRPDISRPDTKGKSVKLAIF